MDSPISFYSFFSAQGIMIARGGNNRGVVGVIPEGPKESNICLRVAKVAADGQNTAPISALLEGMFKNICVKAGRKKGWD